jgi:hypothetical protein
MSDPLVPQRDDAAGEAATPSGDELPAELRAALDQRGVVAGDEVALRRELERHLPGYTLYRLMPAAARRWKCTYRIMFGATYFDCQTVPEAYARALLAALDGKANDG